jgi:hypothetical protein
MLGTRIPSPLRRLSPSKRDLLEAAREGNLSVKLAGTLEVPGQGRGAEVATEAGTATKVPAMCSEAANVVAEAAIEAVREAAREEDIEVTREVTREVSKEEDIEVTREESKEEDIEVTREESKEEDIEGGIEVLPEIV